VPEEGARGGYTGWVLPLHSRAVDTLAGTPAYTAIEPSAAAAVGVPVAPEAVWLLSPRGAPCRATAGRLYAAAVDGPPSNLAYGVELAGCAAPPDATDATAIALVAAGPLAATPPTGCQALAPRLVAARLGEHDQRGRWQRPSRETPIPPALAAVIPDRVCAAPTCEKLWSIAQVDVADRVVAWAAAVNWLAIPAGADPADACKWKAEAFSGVFVPTAGGSASRVTAGQARPLILSAVLADRGGAKVLIASGPGEYATYDLGADGARLARALVWLQSAPESYSAVEQLGPDCDM
jgi:hypothetical protein